MEQQAFLVSQLVSVFNSQPSTASATFAEHPWINENDLNLIEDEQLYPNVNRTQCPVCLKEFKKVAIHIGKSRDQAHKDYKANQEKEQIEQVVDDIQPSMDSTN